MTWEIIGVASRSHFIKLELFELVNCGIGRVATVIPKALLVINQNRIFRNVAADINREKL